MGWFGGGGSSEPKPETNFTSSDDAYSAGPAGGFSPGMAGGGEADLRAKAAQLQQAAATNQIIQMFSGMAFEKCVQKPDSSLSSSQIACIEGTVGKLQDFQTFVLERMKRKAQGGH